MNVGNTLNFTSSPGDQTGYTRSWTITPSNGGSFSNSAAQNPTFTASTSSGSPYNVKVSFVNNTSLCSRSSLDQSIDIYPELVATAGVKNGYNPDVCAGSNLRLSASQTGGSGTPTYLWEYVGGTFAGAPTR